jgi:ComF family protein
MISDLSLLGRVLLDFILPSPCRVCGVFSASSRPVCRACLETIRPVPHGCSCCGRPHGDKKIRFLVDHFQCGECLEKKPAFTEARSSVIYEGAARKLICLFKYKRKTRLKKIFTPFILDTLAAWDVMKKCDGIVPVPLHTRKFRDRTFNPSLLLADVIAENFGIPVWESCLIRPKEGIKQAGLTKKKRREAVKGVFAVQEEEMLKGKRILLVDDVFTTGATARECAKILKKMGAVNIYVFTLARTVK